MNNRIELLDNSPVISANYEMDARILNEKINNPNVKNIAIVAKLGAGKSSVIETYLSKFRKKDKRSKNSNKSKYVKISLATFNKEKYSENDIERSILQQLLYSQNSHTLPHSKIERTNSPSMLKTLLNTVCIIVAILSFTFLTIKLANNNFFNDSFYIILAFFVASFGCVIYSILYFGKLKKVKYKDFEVETESKDTLSIINKMVDEILYFFERVKVDLVIFEDLDRLPETEIFVKLRELNTIINNSSNKKCKKVTFLYAIKNDLIESEEERAKFFDFILSIIPIINPITAEEKIREIFSNREKEVKLNDEFVKDVSFYIPDMRVLKNTVNDYIITRSRIVNEFNKDRMKNEILFTLSLYRNLFPKEYTELEDKTSEFICVLNRDTLVNILCEKTKKEIIEYENKLSLAENEKSNDIGELKLILKGMIGSESYSYSNATLIPFDSISSFKNIDWNNISHPYYHGYKVVISTIKMEEIRKFNFAQREENIIYKAENKKEEINAKISDLNNLIFNIANLPFNELVNQIGVDEVFNKFLKNNEELQKLNEPLTNFWKFAIKNGYIDDHYTEYIYNFDSEIISPTDIEFIKKVQIGINDYNYKIENIPEIIKRIKVSDFKYPSVINKYLISYVIDAAKEIDSNKKEVLLKTLVSDKSLKYLLLYYGEEDEMKIIELTKLITFHQKICLNIIESALINEKKEIVINTILNQCFNNIKSYNQNNCLTNYFSNKKDINNLLNGLNINDAVLLLDDLNPKFDTLNDTLCSKELMEHIIANNYYEITIDNLLYIISLKNYDNKSFFSNNYSFIKNNFEGVYNYLEQNINIYLTKILLDDRIEKSPENRETAYNFIKLDETVTIENKIGLLNKYQIKIDDLYKVNPSVSTYAFENNFIELSSNNIVYMYDNYKPKEILKYLIRNVNNIDMIDINNDNKTALCSILNEECDSIDLFNSLINKINGKLSANDITNDTNLIELIKSDRISYNEKDFSILNERINPFCEYLNHFEAEILKEFETFFPINMTSSQIDNILLSKLKYNSLKQRIITYYYNKINITDNEIRYANLITENKFVINEAILFQFNNCRDHILNLIYLTDFANFDRNTLENVKRMLSIYDRKFANLENESFDIHYSEGNINCVKKLKQMKILDFNRKKGRIFIKKFEDNSVKEPIS